MVEETLSRVGRRIVLGTPLGLGKPNLAIAGNTIVFAPALLR